MILNVGCGGRPHDKMVDYGDIRIDIEPFPSVTHVIDAHDLPQEWSEKFTEVACYTLLEHVHTPIRVLEGMTRVLKTGGTLVIIVPNVHYWRRIYRNYKCRLDIINKADPEKLPDHKAGWDLMEFTNFFKQVPGLKLVKVEYLDWQPEWKHRSGGLFGRVFDRVLPPLFTHVEVKFVLTKEDPQDG